MDELLVDGVTSLFTPGHTAPTSVPSVKTNASGILPNNIIAKFPGLTRPTGTYRVVQHSTTHYIRRTPGRPRRLVPDCLVVAKAEYDAILQDGTARRAQGPWTALHLISKKDSGWRQCVVYSLDCTPELSPIDTPSDIQDYAHHLSRCTISKIDLVRAYHQIPVNPEDIQKIVIPPLLTVSNIIVCSLAWGTPPKPFNAAWTRY